ncbi:hypothetical protein AV530_008456 [Patagioenas fasciata monilis]|uniref:Uncharacterized protein n=1 Tax=Patagioenas fasciata monilis TaxID=372326 RepID=A0A1V4JCZ3_PATFA|nr:hypothetical protein AV530_008456 [Patagioenas fasciata monilis]
MEAAAIFNRDIEEVRSLLNQKENINVLDQERRTPLHAAAYIGDVAILELLILSGEGRHRGNDAEFCSDTDTSGR